MNIANKTHSQSSIWGYKTHIEEGTDGLLTPEIETPLLGNSLALTTIDQPQNSDWDTSFMVKEEYESPLPLVPVIGQGIQSPLATPELDSFSDIDLIRRSIASLDMPKVSSLEASRDPQCVIKREDDFDDVDEDPNFEINNEPGCTHDLPYRYRPAPKKSKAKRGKSRGRLGRPPSNASETLGSFISKNTELASYLTPQSKERVMKQLQRSTPSVNAMYQTMTLPTPSYAHGVAGPQVGSFNFFNLRKKGAWRRDTRN